MKKIGILCLIAFLLVGCGRSGGIQEETTQEEATMDSLDDTYYKIVNFGRSDLRENFYSDFSSTKDFDYIGRDLQIISGSYFSTSDYYMSEGQYFNRERRNNLLNWDGNYSIQVPKGTTVEGVKSPILFSNLLEQDFYTRSGSTYTLSGIALSIIMDPLDSQGQALTTPLSEKTIKKYGKDCIKKVYQYFTESADMAEIGNVPILIAVYQATDQSRNNYNGKYIYECYCDGSLGDIKELNHTTVIFSSSEAEKLDKKTYDEFNEIKNNLKSASTEAAGLVGEAKYIDGKIQSMVINANLNIKTITELQYLTSLLADQIDSHFSYSFDIKVLVNSQDGLKAVIIKDAGEKAKSSIIY